MATGFLLPNGADMDEYFETAPNANLTFYSGVKEEETYSSTGGGWLYNPTGYLTLANGTPLHKHMAHVKYGEQRSSSGTAYYNRYLEKFVPKGSSPGSRAFEKTGVETFLDNYAKIGSLGSTPEWKWEPVEPQVSVVIGPGTLGSISRGLSDVEIPNGQPIDRYRIVSHSVYDNNADVSIDDFGLSGFF